MKRLGLTGNIGTGKTTIARIFEIFGIPVYHADMHARHLLETESVKQHIVSQFGKTIINPQNQIDRKALAEIVFSNPEKLAELNKIMHPLVKADFELWCENHKNEPYILHEAAILFESGFNKLFDSVILVTAPEDLCINRVMNRDGITKEMVLNRMRNQWSQQKKMELSDYIVVNDEQSMVIPQLFAIHNSLLAVK